MAADAAGAGHDGGSLSRTFDAVIVGLDPSVDYRRLAVAMRAVSDGARLIATNADARYPTAVGFLPGAGSIVAALATATGTMPEVIGKPAPAMFAAILEVAGVEPDEAVVVGDNPDADVAGANRSGIASILVLTGVADAATAGTLDGERRPSAVADGPDAVRTLLADRVSR
jgi:glycerol-1-phosphatase